MADGSHAAAAVSSPSGEGAGGDPGWKNILGYWFGDGATDDAQQVIQEKSALWWGKDPDTDRDIRTRFMGLYTLMQQGGLADWKLRPHTRLAMIILADQFPRNMFRGQAQAFATDPLALELALEGIRLSMDRELRWIERVFFYMPLEHSESPEIQAYSVRTFRALAGEVPAADRKIAAGYLDFAERHHAVIAKFGRFPHRNGILDRKSTAEEIVFLREPGSSF